MQQLTLPEVNRHTLEESLAHHKEQLAHAEAMLDPYYHMSDDHGVWLRHNNLALRITDHKNSIAWLTQQLGDS